MIKADLSYNPYIRELKVQFNGHPPRINSMIEKYQRRPLQDWIAEIPQIFHDEMNGYGFQLDFYGTELDFDEVKNAFLKAGVSERDVQISLKNELECREVKIEKLRVLHEWLNEYRYRNFDYDKFKADNHDILESDFVGIVLHGNSVKPKLKGVSVENVDSIKELECTDLTHTPILYCITRENTATLHKDINYLRKRKDTADDQLFFCVSKDENIGNIKRLLNDIGIAEPVIVRDINDDAVRKYFLIYPFTDHISSAIECFRNAIENVSEIINKDNEKSKLNGDRTHDLLAEINEKADKIRNCDSDVINSDKPEYLHEYDELVSDFIDKISNWESQKTKITDPVAAKKAVTELVVAVNKFYSEFAQQLNSFIADRYNELHEKFASLYDSAVPDDNYSDNIPLPSDIDIITVEDQTEKLMQMKEVRYVDHKNNRIKNIFRANNNPTSEQPTVENIYYYQAWRNCMINIMLPYLKEMIDNSFTSLTDHAKQLSTAYHIQLQTQLEKTETERERITNNLSEEEKILQKDNEWLNTFIAKLESIEWS